MKGFVLAIALSAPVAVMAEDKAAMCVSAIEAMSDIEEAAAAMTDDAAAFHDDMKALRERYGQAAGAALEMQSERHMLQSASDLRGMSDLAEDVRQIVLAYCAQP